MKAQAPQILRQIANSHSKALRSLGQTVDYARDEVIDEALACLCKDEEVFLMGVKNTSSISREYVDILRENGFLWHTLDKVGEKGRAVYTGLYNPLTGRPMTGSSATTAMHVLQNINHIGIGTDGGGSVLAPALACGLYAIIGKGLGLVGNGNRISTDGIAFAPAIGIIAQNYELCQKAIRILIDGLPKAETGNRELTEETSKPATENVPAIRSGIEPKKTTAEQSNYLKEIGIVVWEDEEDSWTEELRKMLGNYSLRIFKAERTEKREKLIEIYHNIMQQVPILIAKEGPVDVNGLGDSIIGSFGETGKQIQASGQKYFVKIANLVDATAVAVPSGELASGYVILAEKGVESGRQAMAIGSELASKITLPKVFENYFFDESMNKGFL